MLTGGNPCEHLGARQGAVAAVAPGRQNVVHHGVGRLQQVEPAGGFAATVRRIGQVVGAVTSGPDRGGIDEPGIGGVDGGDMVALGALDPECDGVSAAVWDGAQSLLCPLSAEVMRSGCCTHVSRIGPPYGKSQGPTVRLRR